MTKNTPFYGDNGQGPSHGGSGPGYNNQYAQGGDQSNYNQNYDQNYNQGGNYNQSYSQGQHGYGQQGGPQGYNQYNAQPQSQGNWNQYQGGYPPHTHGPEVEAFKSHFDQPSGPPQGHNSEYYNQQPQQHQQYQQPPQHQQYQQQQQQPYGNPQFQGGEDRGVLGALGGAAAGGFAGHKMGNHGILGALGGAVAGHLLEEQAKKHGKDDKHDKKDKKDKHDKHDKYDKKDKHDKHDKHDKKDKKDKHDKHDRDLAYGQYGQQSIGNFSASSGNAWLEHDQILVAECKDVNGHTHQSRIDLNDCLANHNGEFRWARHGGFKGSAKDIKFKEDGAKLKAKLRTSDGDWEEDSIKLNERIGNNNGQLVFID